MMDVKSYESIVVNFLESSFLFSFKDRNIGESDNLFKAGVLDSFGLVQLISFLEAEFHIEITPEDMASPKLSTLAGIIQLVSERS